MKTWQKVLIAITIGLFLVGLGAAGSFRVASASEKQPSVIMIDVNGDGQPDYQVLVTSVQMQAKLSDGTAGLWLKGVVSQISPLPTPAQ